MKRDCLCIPFLLFLGLSALVASAGAATNGVESPGPATEMISLIKLTAQEQHWLAGHPVIRLGFDSCSEPLLIQKNDDSLEGIYPTIFAELEKIIGVRFDIEVDEWRSIIRKARHREIDGCLACAPSQAQASKLLQTLPIHMVYPVVFIRHDAPFAIRQLSDLKGKRIAYGQEVKMLEVILDQYKETSKIIAVDSIVKAMGSVLENKADLAFGLNFQNYLVAKYAITGIKLEYYDLEHQNPVGTCIRDDWPELVAILNKGLSHIGPEKIQHILAQWITGTEPRRMLHLTPEEKMWLVNHPVIRVGADADWAPIEFLDTEGSYKGLSIDYLRKIERMLGVDFKFVRGSWQELIALAKQEELDMFDCMAKTAERERYLLFTEPYTSMPTGIFVRQDAAYISDLNTISGKKIVAVEGYAIHDFLVANYPNINLILVKKPEKGIQTVMEGKAFAFIDNTITTGHLISRKGYVDIKLAGEIPFIYDQCMGVRKDWPQLKRILQKAIDAIPPAERNAMYSQWVPLTYEKPADYSLLWKIGILGLSIVSAVFLWNRKLASEVKKRTTALIRENLLHQQAQTKAHLGHWELDHRNNYLSWSDEVYRIFELDPARFTPSYEGFLNLVHLDDRKSVNKAFTDSFKSGTPFDIVHRLHLQDGLLKYVNEHCETYYDEQGQPIRSVGTVFDITRLKEAELELKRHRDSLEELVAQRTEEIKQAKEEAEMRAHELVRARRAMLNIMDDLKSAGTRAEEAARAKTMFLANMSHEIRTPLNAILGYSQLISHDASLTAEQKENLGIINRSGEHLLGLINDVLELSKIEANRSSLTTVHFDLHGMLTDMASMFKLRAAAKQLRFVIQIDDALPRYIFADQGKLRQILINLLGNAVKFTVSGRISLRASVDFGGDLPLIIEIEDTGIGISIEDQNKIFQSFEQTSAGAEIKSSAGLGLAISLGYARLMGGGITVTSELGEGSIFRLSLPLKEGKLTTGIETTTARRVVGLAPGRPVPKILIVDDETTARSLLMKILKFAGFDQVSEAANGREALDSIKREPPDIVLMDIKMPVMNGLEAMAIIHDPKSELYHPPYGKVHPAMQAIPIIAVSASAFEEDRQKILAAGADSLIRKPFHDNEILTCISRHLGVEYLYENGQTEDAYVEEETNLSQEIADLPVELLEKIRTTALHGEVAECMTIVEKIRQMSPSTAVSLEQVLKTYQFDKLYTIVQNELKSHQKETSA